MKLKQWFTADELKDKSYLPKTANSISRKATKDGWMKKQRKGVRGTAYEYHYSSLPLETQRELGFLSISQNLDHETREPETTYNDHDNLIAISEYDADTFSPSAQQSRTIYLLKDHLLTYNLAGDTLSYVKMRDDSMHPLIEEGEEIIVKHLPSSHINIYNGVFLLKLSVGIAVKRLEYCISRDGYYIRNENKSYQDDFISLEEFTRKIQVVGQAVNLLMHPLSLKER